MNQQALHAVLIVLGLALLILSIRRAAKMKDRKTVTYMLVGTASAILVATILSEIL